MEGSLTLMFSLPPLLSDSIHTSMGEWLRGAFLGEGQPQQCRLGAETDHSASQAGTPQEGTAYITVHVTPIPERASP